MSQSKKRGIQRLAALFVVVAMAAALIAPAVAQAVTQPTPTLYLSTSYQPTAAPMIVSGYVGPAYAGTKVNVYVKKPGRTYWSVIGSPAVRSTGKFHLAYTPKLAGKYWFRANLRKTTSTWSPYRSLFVRKGPGTKTEILLASTTSTRDSGLFERIGPAFLTACPEYTLKATFVGSGAAMALGGSGDADVLLTHSPAMEREFMTGYLSGVLQEHKGKTRYKVMYNDYVLVGPKTNPYAIATTDTAAAAFSKFSTETASGFTTGTAFWSRNDKSGTNEKEKAIWATIGSPQVGASWYKASGTMGMAAALAAANDLTTGGYTLSDRGTWLMANTLGTVKNLKIVNEGDSTYFNQYSVIEVDGARNWEGAQDFSQWIRSPQAQELIRTYGEYTYGSSMFTPNAGSYAPGQ